MTSLPQAACQEAATRRYRQPATSGRSPDDKISLPKTGVKVYET